MTETLDIDVASFFEASAIKSRIGMLAGISEFMSHDKALVWIKDIRYNCGNKWEVTMLHFDAVAGGTLILSAGRLGI
jgi:hypothetical protein